MIIAAAGFVVIGIAVGAFITNIMKSKSSCRKSDHSYDLMSIRHSLLGEEFYVIMHLDSQNKNHSNQAQQIEQYVCDRLPGAKIYWNDKKDTKPETIVVDFLYQNIYNPTFVDVRSIALDLSNGKDIAIVKNLIQFWHILNRYSGGEIMSRFVDNPESFSIDDLLALDNKNAKKIIQEIIELQATDETNEEETKYRDILNKVFDEEKIKYTSVSSKNIADYLNQNIPLN